MMLDLNRLERVLDEQITNETYSALVKWMKKKGMIDPHLGNTDFGFKKEDFEISWNIFSRK